MSDKEKETKLTIVSLEPVDAIDEASVPKPAAGDAPTDSKANDPKESEEPKESEPKEAESNKEQDENVPAQPLRPVSPKTRAIQELKAAFPAVDDKYITAVLIASSGQLDPAFNALLYISDPTFEPEIPTPVASTPTLQRKPIRNATLNDDELLARKLQQEFEREERKARQGSSRRQRSARDNHQSQEDSPDEFEQIKESFSQGLEEARSTLNGWVSGLAKKFQDVDEDEPRTQAQAHQGYSQRQQPQHNQQQQQPKLFGALGGSSYTKRSNANTARFDEDPVILNNDFHSRISLSNNDDADEPGPQLPRRKADLSDKPLPAVNPGKVGDTPAAQKWQPLNTAPVNSDAFLVNDSDEEEEEPAKKTT